MDPDSLFDTGDAIAVVGMACRFPGAPDLDAYWNNLIKGVCGVTFFNEDELRHLPAEMTADNNYVKARGIIEGIELFDADAFGLNARDANLLDPQHRLLLETAWHALEHAGLNPALDQSVGVFAGVGSSLYARCLALDPQIEATVGALQLAIGNETDYPAPRLSYLLNLKGPSIPVQTACSTSLVAVHMACQSLLSHECDAALAGGAALPYLQKTGYVYQKDGIYSPDGLCRAFDAEASGTVPGSGSGMVVLKRLEDAREKGDCIYAVIAGSAVNNDGADKVGFTAPSVSGQRQVIEEAQALAEVAPSSVAYVETHGTGTSLGDPIEIEALRQAFGELPPESCALGAVKTNIGHAGAAAGVAGLIKAVLCRHYGVLVPTLHFERPNPKLALESSPFYVNTETKSWPEEQPLAGVSSFGIGGTNAHLLIGPAPARREDESSDTLECQVLALSARDTDALEQHSQQVAAYLAAHPDVNLGDVAYSLNTGRRHFEYRTWVMAKDVHKAAEAVKFSGNQVCQVNAAHRVEVIFCFTGQGVAVCDWGQDLYASNNFFHESVDRACEAIQPHLDSDLKSAMFECGPDPLPHSLHQPALFVLGWSLAQTWMAYGIQPAAVMGHSVGEYAAAAIAGLMSLDDAAKLVACRGAETAKLATGAMTALPIPEADAGHWLGPEISLAAVNSPGICVFSGPEAAIDDLESRARGQQLRPIRLPSDRAFHSAMVDEALAALTACARQIHLQPLQTPLISGLSGDWMTPEEASDPEYWATHMRQTVRFHDALKTASSLEGALLLEVGSGHTLTRLVTHMGDKAPAAIPSLAPKQATDVAFAQAAGALWAHGANLDWPAWFHEKEHRKIALPGYPFQRQEHWIRTESAITPTGKEDRSQRSLLETRRPMTEWYYQPIWSQVPSTAFDRKSAFEPGQVWLLMAQGPITDALSSRLIELGQKVVWAQPGKSFREMAPGQYELNPACAEDYRQLLQALKAADCMPQQIIHAWSLAGDQLQWNQIDNHLDWTFSSLVRTAQGLAELESGRVRLLAVTSGMWTVGTRSQENGAWRAALLGATRILPLEYDFLQCGCHDTGNFPVEDWAWTLIDRFAAEWDHKTLVSAHGLTWQRSYERIKAPTEEKAAFGTGVYLVLNGFQPMGYALNQALQSQGATVILADRAFLPERTEWDNWLEDPSRDEETSRILAALKDGGPRVFPMSVDPGNPAAMRKMMETIKRQHGRICGTFLLDQPSDASLIGSKPASNPAPILSQKVREALALTQTLNDADLLVICTANRDEAGGIGQSEQVAAYAFLEVFAKNVPRETAARTLLVEWGVSAQEMQNEAGATMADQLAEKRRRFGMTPETCVAVLQRLVASSTNHVVISTRDYPAVLSQQQQFTAAYFKAQAAESHDGKRPKLSTAFKAPASDVEKLLTELWEAAFAIKPIGAEDDFFELGGHSLLAVDLLAQMERTFGANVNLEDLFANPTIAQLARKLSSEEVEVQEADQMASLLNRIEGMSPEEVDALLEDL